MSRQTQRYSARSARLEAVRKHQRSSAHRRTALIVTASLAVFGWSAVRHGRSWVPAAPGLPPEAKSHCRVAGLLRARL
jgi:hypothetical protein